MSLIPHCATYNGNVLYAQPRPCLLALTGFYFIYLFIASAGCVINIAGSVTHTSIQFHTSIQKGVSLFLKGTFDLLSM